MDNDDVDDDLKARIQELEDELQKLKEQKRQNSTDSAAVDEEIEEVHDQIRDEADQSGMSRRKFMKAIAGGGAALGAAAMMPSAAALDIESNNPLSYNDNFSVDTQGNLNLHGNNITNAGSVGAASVTTEELGIPSGAILVDGLSGTSVEYRQISEYDDLFDAVATAISDLPPSGGTIVVPNGDYTVGTQLVIDKPINFVTEYSQHNSRQNGDEYANVVINWTGGTTIPLVLRGSEETPVSTNDGNDVLSGVTIGSFLLRPETAGGGDTAIYLDGTASGSSVVREVEMNKTTVWGWGGTSPVIFAEGTTFGVYLFQPTAAKCTGNIVEVDPSNASEGPASEYKVRDPRMRPNDGYWGLKLVSNSVDITGGKFQQNNPGANGIWIGGSGIGAISGTTFEGASNFNGGVAIRVSHSVEEVKRIEPAAIRKYDRGVEVGDGRGNTTKHVHIHGGFNGDNGANNTDVYIYGGAGRYGLKVMSPTPNGIVDNRGVEAKGEGLLHLSGEEGNHRPFHHVNKNNQTSNPVSGQLFAIGYDGDTFGQDGARLEWYNEQFSEFQNLHADYGSYTGDGTSSQSIPLEYRPTAVVIDDGSNTALLFRGGTTIPMRGSVGGSISLDATGFTVGDGGSDAFPNTNGVTYNFLIL